jgi:hypothetical protein
MFIYAIRILFYFIHYIPLHSQINRTYCVRAHFPLMKYFAFTIPTRVGVSAISLELRGDQQSVRYSYLYLLRTQIMDL